MLNYKERYSDECFEEKDRLQVKPERVMALFKDLLRCFSEVDCYRENWSDDTARVFTFAFRNGEIQHYSEVFYYDEYEKEINSEDIIRIRTFIEECQSCKSSGEQNGVDMAIP